MGSWRLPALFAAALTLAAPAGVATAGDDGRVGRAGVTVELPSGWRTTPRREAVAEPAVRIAVSSSAFPTAFPRCPGQIASYAPAPNDVSLVVVEWQRLQQNDPLPGRLAQQTLRLQPPPAIECFGGAGGAVFFSAHRRRLGAYVLLGRRAPRALADEALAVLQTVRIEPVRAVELVPLSPRRLAHCRRSALLRPACPRLVPRVRAAYLSRLATNLLGRGSAQRLAAFGLERGGEDLSRPERNRPPRTAHLEIAAGEVGALSTAAFAPPRRARLRNGLLLVDRARSLDLGPWRVAMRRGRLLLVPASPPGGALGNHLVFRWREDGVDLVVSLHAWEPLREAASTLRAVVASTGR